MTELTSTARVGRSLGVHLILATQKPGGVVDDQIRSNSRFRICLKVQDNGDSMEMLKRTDAASLVDTGRFYLQVGNNELFEIGQSAWAGAPYYPSSQVIKDRDDAISVINTNGRVIAEANVDRFAHIKDPPKQLDVITKYINKVSEDKEIKRWKMWLDPIPSHIYVDDLTTKYSSTKSNKFVLNPIVGEFDDPAHQTQGVLRVPITNGGNVIVYGSAGNGKEMFIEAMCYSLMNEHSPEEVNIYILDFGSETLTSFSKAPHVGEVVLSREAEKIGNLFKLLNKKLEARRKLFVEYGGDLLQYNRSATQSEPNIVVIINNYAIFTDLYGSLYEQISYLTTEGAKYGIYFVLTCTGTGNVRYNLLQNFKNIYCLQLNNANDYSSVVGRTGGMLPEAIKGRGLFRKDKDSLFEIQVASITKEETSFTFINAFSQNMADKYKGMKIKNIPILPKVVTEEFLMSSAENGNLKRIPIGVEKETLDIAHYDFTSAGVHLVMSANQEWKNFVDSLSSMLSRHYFPQTLFFSPGSTAKQPKDDTNVKIAVSASDCATMINDIVKIFQFRVIESRKEGDIPSFEPLLIVIHSITALTTMLAKYTPEGDDTDTPAPNGIKLSAYIKEVMQNCEEKYNMYFLVTESASQLSVFSIDNWYKAHIANSNCIWVGSGLSGQYQLKLNKIPPDYKAELDSTFGFVLKNAKATLVKFLQTV